MEKTDNEIIAEFMGGVFNQDEDNPNKWFFNPQPHSYYRKDAFHFSMGLKYNTDWNWLMPVVEKIHKTNKMVTINFYSDADVVVTKVYSWGIGDSLHDEEFEEPKAIDSVYKAVVNFIKWYNQQSK